MQSDGRHDTNHQGNTIPQFLASYTNSEHPVLITSGIKYFHYRTLAGNKRQ